MSNNDINERISELMDILTDEQYAFCEEYLKNLTAPAAVAVCKSLPYEENPRRKARELIGNKNVEEYLDLRRKQERRARLNKDDILLNMYDLFLKTKESSQSNNEIDAKGQPKQNNYQAAVKMAELLAKHFNIIDDKSNSNNNIEVAPKVNIDKDDLDKFTQEFNAEY
jgi:hypothetical protein